MNTDLTGRDLYMCNNPNLEVTYSHRKTKIKRMRNRVKTEKIKVKVRNGI